THRIDEEKKAKADTEASYRLELRKQEETTRRLDVELRNAERAAEVWRREVDANGRLRGKQVVTEIQFLNVQRSHEEAIASVQKYESMRREAAAEKLLLDKKFETARTQHDRTTADLQEQLDLNATNQAAAAAEVAQRQDEYDVAETD